MANVNISHLAPAGSELFHDSESFIQDITEQESGEITGGWFVELLWSGICFGG